MVILQARSKRKVTGGRYIDAHKKKTAQLGRFPASTKLDTESHKIIVRTRGNNVKEKLLKGNVVNLYDPSSKTFSKATIKTVSGNAANRHFIRRNIITKGAVIETEKGKARVTSRPGQVGVIDAVLITQK
jgi:small subunit ribosomal protein S8e